MLKRLFMLSIMFILVMVYGITSFANSNYIMQSGTTRSTGQFLVNITRPEGNETTYKKTYIICGNSTKQDIRVKVLIYSYSTGTYETFKSKDGVPYSWDISGPVVFTKEVSLPEIGANKIRVVAYNKYEDNLELGRNLQVNNFTVTLLKRSVKDSIKDGVSSITDMLSQLFD